MPRQVGLLVLERSRMLQLFVDSVVVWGFIGSWWGSRRERDHWEGLGADGWIILGWISRR